MKNQIIDELNKLSESIIRIRNLVESELSIETVKQNVRVKIEQGGNGGKEIAIIRYKI